MWIDGWRYKEPTENSALTPADCSQRASVHNCHFYWNIHETENDKFVKIMYWL